MTATLEGYGALVTGGGTGIGHACAAALAADGATVTICGRTESKLIESAARANTAAAHGGSVRHQVADVTDEAAVESVVSSAAEAADGLQIVVANAGGGGGLGPYDQQDVEQFRSVLDLNVVGTMLCVKHAVPIMRSAGRGSFVAMSSIAGGLTHRYFGAYTAGKAGIEAIVRNAADEFGSVNLRFNAIRPGFISTEIMEGIPRDGSVYRSYIENTPMANVGDPEDVALLARFLAGPESRWITGQVIAVDGGHSLRTGPDFSEYVSGHG